VVTTLRTSSVSRNKVAERRNRDVYGTVWDRHVGRPGCNIVEPKRNDGRPLLGSVEKQHC
jgi:hypothetical protein